MPTDYTNIIFSKVIESLATIINGEFSIPINYDEHKGNQSFLLTPISDSLVTLTSTGQQREYSIEISYQLKSGGQYTKNNLKQVSNVLERLKRVLYDNVSYSNGADWFEANISSIEYGRNEDDQSILTGVAIFNCQNIEVV